MFKPSSNKDQPFCFCVVFSFKECAKVNINWYRTWEDFRALQSKFVSTCHRKWNYTDAQCSSRIISSTTPSSLASQNWEIWICQKSSDMGSWEVGESFILRWEKNYPWWPWDFFNDTQRRRLIVHSRTMELRRCKLCRGVKTQLDTSACKNNHHFLWWGSFVWRRLVRIMLQFTLAVGKKKI